MNHNLVLICDADHVVAAIGQKRAKLAIDFVHVHDLIVKFDAVGSRVERKRIAHPILRLVVAASSLAPKPWRDSNRN